MSRLLGGASYWGHELHFVRTGEVVKQGLLAASKTELFEPDFAYSEADEEKAGEAKRGGSMCRHSTASLPGVQD